MTSARFFIRNDDPWTLDREFRYFFDLAIKHKIPVIHAVIPGKIDEPTVRFLCQAKARNPHLLDIVQHGWMHKNYSKKIGTKYEFGPLRSLKSQREDIQQGLRKMQQAFGEYFTRAFVPPYHGYDERTLRILKEEGFKIFSAGYPSRGIKRRFIDLSVQVSFSRYDLGETSVYKASEVIANLVKSVAAHSIAGVVTHHADFKTAASRKELVQFFKYMAALNVKQGWKGQLFKDISND